MTFSIVARSHDGESWGVAVASKFLAVGSAVPAAVAGIGAVATQADANVAWKGEALSPARRGRDRVGGGGPAGRGRRQAATHRQVGIVDGEGNAAAHTGDDCLVWAGGLRRPRRRHAGQRPGRPEVLSGDEGAWDASPDEPDLGRRLLAALQAGDARRRRPARPAVRGAAGGPRRRRVRRPGRRRRRPAGRRPPRPVHRARPAARAQRALPHRVERGGEGAARRGAARRARGARPLARAARPRRVGRQRELRDARGAGRARRRPGRRAGWVDVLVLQALRDATG